MGEIEINKEKQTVTIVSEIVIYGDSATNEIAAQIAEEIETLFNDANGTVKIEGEDFEVKFKITSVYKPDIDSLEILSNTNPRMNYFRVEDFSPLNISWVDGINSNTGYFLIDNLYLGSTTAAHEYGHTLGLDHPEDLNLIGKGTPGIMYPRGTLVDPIFQYDPQAEPATKGGTIHPMYRRVSSKEIDLLRLDKFISQGKTYLGRFTSVYHNRHFKPVSA